MKAIISLVLCSVPFSSLGPYFLFRNPVQKRYGIKKKKLTGLPEKTASCPVPLARNCRRSSTNMPPVDSVATWSTSSLSPAEWIRQKKKKNTNKKDETHQKKKKMKKKKKKGGGIQTEEKCSGNHKRNSSRS